MQDLEAKWLDFLSKLFETRGLTPFDQRQAGRHGSPDLDLRSASARTIVELKLHRSEQVPLSLVRNAFFQLDHWIKKLGADEGILVVPQRLADSKYAGVRPDHVQLWDLDRLIAETNPQPGLASQLAELLRALRFGADKQPQEQPELAEELPPLGAGTELANRLEELSPGRKDGAAHEFERLCEDALRLLFGRDLLGWRRQSNIENGFQRVDLIACLQPTKSAFWTTLAFDFRTRYVVFEFKNYTNEISQDQVYATEKYLFTTALRAVAIIIARKGANNSADRAMRGALREQGKLIICLSMNEFCELLRGFDVGNSPEELLVSRLDNLLMGIGR